MKLPEFLTQRPALFFNQHSAQLPISGEKSAYARVAESSSDTDSLLEHEHGNVLAVVQPASRSRWTYRAVMTGIFALFNLAFFVTVWFNPSRNRPLDVSDAIFPRVEYETIIFHEEQIFPGPEGDKIWKDELPHGGGFTIVDDPDHYKLPAGQTHGGDTKMYGVSWAHQYHCVWMVRQAFWDLVHNRSSLVNADQNDHTEEGDKLWHLAHCFGYLRQHIVCNMDMTLEWPTLGGTNEGTINGYEIPHQCKRRQALDKYMDEHAPSHE